MKGSYKKLKRSVIVSGNIPLLNPLNCNHSFAHKRLDKEIKKISRGATLSIQCEYCGIWLSDKGQKVEHIFSGRCKLIN